MTQMCLQSPTELGNVRKYRRRSGFSRDTAFQSSVSLTARRNPKKAPAGSPCWLNINDNLIHVIVFQALLCMK
jgi:hypothetical protein